MVAPFPQPQHEESALERFYGQKPWYRRLVGRIGLQTKLTWCIIVLMAITLGSYGFASLQDTRRKLKENLSAEAQQSSSMLAVLAAEMPADLSTPAMRRVVGPFIKTGQDILFVTLIDADGNVLLTETRSGAVEVSANAPPLQPNTTSWEKNDAFGPHVVSTAPIIRRNRSGVTGYVQVGVSLRQYDAQIHETTETAARVGGALVLLAIPASWLMVRRIFSPIRKLARAAQRIAAGEFDTRVADNRSGAIGELGQAFNHMVQTITHQQEALRQANQKLYDANRDLETKIEQRTSQLETANKRLSSEIAEKEDFLRAISHDLNAPLRNISGMVTMLQTKKREQLDEDAKHRLERIKKNVEVETDLINELLELSRIKTRRGEMEPINLEQMVWDLRGMFENDLRTKDIQLVVDTTLPELNAERPRIRQIFQNLIDNAIKYMGDHARREIHIGCELQGSEAEFYVRDTGLGIDSEDLGKVFFVFRRGKSQSAQCIGGKGIGLASVKSIVETYAGKIWVESTLGQGSTFRFTINGQHVPLIGGKRVSEEPEEGQPLAANLMNANGPHHQPATVPTESRTVALHVKQHPISILLVDDDADCRLLIRDAIGERADPYVIYEACNGAEALDLLSRKGGEGQDELPSLIFMDVEMPVLGGLDTLQQIKSDTRLKHIPVVMMTGVSDEEHMRRAAECGANSYTLKPADADHFLTTVAASTAYWLSVHQYPQQRLPQSQCRR